MTPSGKLLALILVASSASVGITWVLSPPRAGSVVAELAAASGTCLEGAGPLTDRQVSRAVRDIVPGVLPCVSGAARTPRDVLRLRLHVACTGAVEGVETVERGDWSPEVLDCVDRGLRGASFPPHGLSEGDLVDLPIRFPALDEPSSAR